MGAVRGSGEEFQERLETFTGRTARIIQHKIDYWEGVMI